MIKYIDKKGKFVELFDSKTGFYCRSGIIEKGKDTGIDPFMRTSMPQLIDVGIMGSCLHGQSGLCIKSGVQCYQNGLKTKKPNMPLEDLKKIIDQCKGHCFQFALGGRGDVDQHEEFEEIMKYCRENNIVPNFTSSGLGFTPEIINICKTYAGAIAISWYRAAHTLKAIDMLLEAGIKTNIHYVLGKNTIDEAIDRLENNSFPAGINAIIFLLNKPIGMSSQENCLEPSDPRVKKFFEIIDNNQFDFKVGFDSCTVCGIINFTKNINLDSCDTCEGARYSMYIDAQMNAMPCSFANADPSWHVSLNDVTIAECWQSEPFEKFRNSLRNSCPKCPNRESCMGSCPIVRTIQLCERSEKEFH